jgi:hypothetical protein
MDDLLPSIRARRFAARVLAFCATAAVLLTLVSLAGCTPQSKNPLPESDRIAPDGRLVGRWQASIRGADYAAEVMPVDALTLRVTLDKTLPAGKAPETETAYLLRAYAVGSRTVLGLRQIEPKPGAWRFAAFVFADPSRVTLLFMDDQVVRQVANRAAPSDLIRTSSAPASPDILLTASPKELDTYIRSTDEAELFNVVFGPFERQS